MKTSRCSGPAQRPTGGHVLSRPSGGLRDAGRAAGMLRDRAAVTTEGGEETLSKEQEERARLGGLRAREQSLSSERPPGGAVQGSRKSAVLLVLIGSF